MYLVLLNYMLKVVKMVNVIRIFTAYRLKYNQVGLFPKFILFLSCFFLRYSSLFSPSYKF